MTIFQNVWQLICGFGHWINDTNEHPCNILAREEAERDRYLSVF